MENFQNYQSPQAFVNYLNDMRKKQFYEWTFLNPMQVIDLAAGDSEEVPVDIKSGQHFKCEFMTGNFTTLIDDPLNPGTDIDDGICQMTVEFSDGSNDLELSSGPTLMSLLFSPGRVLSPGITGSKSNQLFIPMKWEHIYGAKGAIEVNFKNASDTANSANICFIGKLLLDQQIKANN